MRRHAQVLVAVHPGPHRRGRTPGWAGSTTSSRSTGRSRSLPFTHKWDLTRGIIYLSAEGTNPHESERVDQAVRLSNSPW